MFYFLQKLDFVGNYKKVNEKIKIDCQQWISGEKIKIILCYLFDFYRNKKELYDKFLVVKMINN